MAKIKKEVEMTLPQLIGWGFKNNIKNRKFISNSKDYTSVILDSSGDIEFSNDFSSEDTFTVEVDEEVTEEKEIDKLVEVYREMGRDVLFTMLHNETSINEAKDESEVYKTVPVAFYVLNDNLNMTLIWKDGELV